jgi:hypothetical protein
VPGAPQTIRQPAAAPVGRHPVARFHSVPVGGSLAQVDEPAAAGLEAARAEVLDRTEEQVVEGRRFAVATATPLPYPATLFCEPFL